MELLITGAWKCTEEQTALIREKGHSVTRLQDESQEMPVPYEKIEGVICNSLFMYHDIRKFTSLRYIQLTSAGLDRVPLDYIEKNSIELRNARGVYSIPMAEYAVGSVLQLYKQSAFFLTRQRQHTWEKHRGLIELYGKNVCIIGCGNVGTECAKRFAAFGCSVIGADKYPVNHPVYRKMYPADELKSAVADADIVILTLPLDGFSRHLIGDEILSVLKQGCVIVNISRGAVIDTEALIPHLQKKRFMAVLDVFEEEPLDRASPLWDLENVVITPHNSFVGENNAERLGSVILENLERYSINNEMR